MHDYSKSQAIRSALVLLDRVLHNQGSRVAGAVCNAFAELPVECHVALFDAVLLAVKQNDERLKAIADLIASTDFTEEKQLVKDGLIINAIKSVRIRIDGFGLKEAKDFVESWPEYNEYRKAKGY